MDDILVRLLNRLEAIGNVSDELYDTDVRERMYEAVLRGFLKPEPGYELGNEFGMFTPQGNRAVRSALSEYIVAANEMANEAGGMTFHQRLEAFQSSTAQSTNEQTHDEFFGWADPDRLDENGDPL